ncbi:kinase-like domain-containing protein [Pilobolus umbonatus]|nr:kinase-like domain-containing protein [Pilobolus umbonatus]
MFNHIKDLFRQRKEKKKFLSSPFRTRTQPKERELSTKSSVKAVVTSKKHTEELAKLVVEEGNKRRSQLPLYPGLERFEMIKKLGDGAFSIVYEAQEIKSTGRVAIKVAQKASSDRSLVQRHLHSNIQKKHRATERANIIKEVEIMQSVRNNSNIVQLLHFSESTEHYFLVLELCGGGELFNQIVKLTYFSEDLSRHVISQLASAIRHLHEVCGVVHRDIKPENILFEPIPIIPSKRRKFRLTDNSSKVDEGEFIKGVGGGGIGKIKLGDFGLSKVIWNSSTLTPCGTVGYTAPEIVCVQQYSKSVDMWATGCVLYTILCGFPPFYDESITQLSEKVSRGEYTFLSPWWDPMSDSVKDLITHLLCVDSSQRYTIHQLLNHPWMRDQTYNKKKLLTSLSHRKRESTPITPPTTTYSTPDVTALRGIFDVACAVQRMGEEQLMDVPFITQKNQNIPMAEKLALHSRGVADPTSHQYPLAQSHSIIHPFDGFNLNLTNATLLKNRKVNMAQ